MVEQKRERGNVVTLDVQIWICFRWFGSASSVQECTCVIMHSKPHQSLEERRDLWEKISHCVEN